MIARWHEKETALALLPANGHGADSRGFSVIHRESDFGETAITLDNATH